MASGLDSRDWVGRHAAFKDLEYCLIEDEDFQGRVLDITNKWRFTAVGAGTAAIQNDRANGILRINTTAAGTNGGTLDKNDIRQIDPSLHPVFAARVQVASVADENMEMKIGIEDVDGTDHAYFYVDRSAVGSLTIWVEIRNNGVQTHHATTTIVLDANAHYYEIVHNPTDHKTYFYIDGVLRVTSDADDLDEAEFFQVYAAFFTENANDKNCDIDLIKCWQRRS